MLKVLWVIGHPRAKSSGRNFVNAANGHRWERIVGHLHNKKRLVQKLFQNIEECVYGKVSRFDSNENGRSLPIIPQLPRESHGKEKSDAKE